MIFRLKAQPNEWIDRQRKIHFEFEGKIFEAYAGDSISSALWANGEKVLGRSFKYHRPRGLFSLANHDINVLLENDDETHIRGDVTLVKDGMSLRATNTRGGLANDHYRWLSKLSKLMPVGFYYKAFFTPRFLFPFWERILRNTAGLGKVNLSWKRRITPKWYEHTDLVVVGSGPSGMQAALTAADYGIKVILVDENPHIGGSLDYAWEENPEIIALRTRLKEQVTLHPKITIKTSTVASGYYADHWIPLAGPQGIAKTRARAVLIATGLIEQPAVFRNNDLPGVMLMSAALRLVARYGVKPGERALVLAGNEEAYRSTLILMNAGIEVAAVVDLNQDLPQSGYVTEVQRKGVALFPGHAIYSAQGSNNVSSATIAPLNPAGECDVKEAKKFDCDCILMSVGWAPAAHLLYQAGGKLTYDEKLNQFIPMALPDGIFAAGSVNGVFDLKAKCEDGEDAAESAAHFILQRSQQDTSAREKYRCTKSHSFPWPIVHHPQGKNFVDFDEDLQAVDLFNAAQEGFDNIELIKRFSTVGMGPSQGKHSNMNAIRVLARIRRQSIDETGSTTARPFYHPQRLDNLAGRRFRVHRDSAMQNEHESSGACFLEAGAWSRPEYYGKTQESEQQIRGEVIAVRQRLGLIDVSTLGKIEVLGPDAERLLHGIYTMRMDTLKIGMTRYALMVDDAGVIVDDGIVGRLSNQHFYVTTTTTHADSSYRFLSRHIAEWGLEVYLVNRTGQTAAVNLAGPHSRNLLEKLTDLPLDDDAFPYLGIREGNIQGIPARLMRVGFIGELSFEIHVPYQHGNNLWKLLIQEGSSFGIRPFGVEAQRRLRLEKGHIIVGQDTDGLTTPYEAAMPWAVHLKKKYFIGRNSLELLQTRTKRMLIGFHLPEDYSGPELLESYLVIHDNNIHGRVTSVGYSPTLGRVIGMALVDQSLLDSEQPLRVRTGTGELTTLERTSMPFYDPDGLRQKPNVTNKQAA